MKIDRRTFLQTAGAATAAAALPSVGHSATGSAPCRLILVNVGGGWDISYALDPKPGVATVDSPEGEIRDFSGLPIFTHESRPNVTAFFEEWAPRTSLIHGLGMRSISHITCAQKLFTGKSSSASPDAGAIVAHEMAGELPLPYLVLGSVAFAGHLGVSTGRVGTINQISALLPPGEVFPDIAQFRHERFEPNAEDEAPIRKFIDGRTEREAATRGARGYNKKRIDDFRASLLKSDAIRSRAGGFGDLSFAFSLSEQADFAVQALSEDLCWTVGLDTLEDWDTHGNNEEQNDLHEGLFEGLAHLAQKLESTAGSGGNTLLDETLVVVMSEMSRTPLLNAGGGKDHWPTTSLMMFGGPVAGGQVFGATNDLVEPELIDIGSGALDGNGTMLEPGHVIAGIIEQAGVDPSLYIEGMESFRAPFV